jgi:hypothetical protein
VKKVEKDLKALANDPNGRMGTHFSFNFESERKGPEAPGPSRYSKDEKVILGLFQKAREAGRVTETVRGATLWESRKPGLPREK